MWRIYFNKASWPAGVSQVVLEHEWREDFVGEALTIVLDEDERFIQMDFYSAEFGCTRWVSGTGVHLPQVWCTNNTREGEPVSYFRDNIGSQTGVHSSNKVITESILRKMPYGYLEKAVRRALLNPHKKVVLPTAFFGGLIGAAA